jgi:ethanolamine ammonia-lyase large subunit
MDALLTLLCAAGVNFIMGVPGADDIMLNYQSTSFHDALAMRQLLGLKAAPEFEAWQQRMGLTQVRAAAEGGAPWRLSGDVPAAMAQRIQRLASP